MPPAALLRYELVLFRRSFADAFSRMRDRLLLAITLSLALLWLRQAVNGPDAFELPPGSELLALAAAPIAFHWNRLAIRRLAWLAEESALAPCAAGRGARLRYLLAAQLPILVPLLAVIAMLGPGTGRNAVAAGLAFAGHGAGALAARARIGSHGIDVVADRRDRSGRPPLSGPRTAFLALLRAQALNSARPGRMLVLLIAANALLTFAGSSLTGDSAPGAHFAASILPSLLLVVATARNDARLAGFLAFAGYRAGFVACAVSALPVASFVAASTAALANGTPASAPVIVTLALLHLGAALLATARAWLSPGREDRRVDFQVQVEAAGLLAVVAMVPPLGLLALAGRLWMLRGEYRDSLWLQR